MPHPKPSELGTSTVQFYSGLCLGPQYTFRGLPDLWSLGLATMPNPCWQTYQTHVTWVGTQVSWVWHVCQTQVNMDPSQLFNFKNNKTIPKYQNAPHDYRKLHKKQCERTKIPPRAKLIFLYLFQD
jgi:hypothetical protein